jgi:hypothetical protein
MHAYMFTYMNKCLSIEYEHEYAKIGQSERIFPIQGLVKYSNT